MQSALIGWLPEFVRKHEYHHADTVEEAPAKSSLYVYLYKVNHFFLHYPIGLVNILGWIGGFVSPLFLLIFYDETDQQRV
jgi:hypothetical protein